MITKLITLLLLIQQYALINTIQPTQPMTHEQAVAVLQVSEWDESLHNEALAIMQCESETIPLALGDYNYGVPYAIGLFQLHWQYYDNYDCRDVLSGVFIGYGAFYKCKHGLDLNPYNVVDNAYLARLVYERSDSWAMWSCSKILDG